MWARLAQTGLIALVGGYLIALGLSGRLSAYIHPRYHLFTLIMAVIAISFALIDLGYQWRRGPRQQTAPTHSRQPRRLPSLISCLTVGILLLGIWLPPQPLSLYSASQRSDASTTLQNPDPDQADCQPPAAQPGQTIPLYRWAVALQFCQQPRHFDGQTVELIGFIHQASVKLHDPAHTFGLSRLVISCCAVDSTPVSLMVDAPHWQQRYREGQWLRVRGILRWRVIGGSGMYLIAEPQITPVNQPTEPYEFWGS